MKNIWQNVTKVDWLRQAKRIGIGSLIFFPIAGLVYLASIINKEALLNTIQVGCIVFFLWSIGGLVESVRATRRIQQEAEMRKTDRAFEKLAGN